MIITLKVLSITVYINSLMDHGKYLFNFMFSYDGQWYDGKMQGIGQYYYPNG